MARPKAEALTNRCTATSKGSGERCKYPSASGSAVCRFHGGAALVPTQEANTIHGRYSRRRYVPDRLRDRVERLRESPDLLDAEHFIALGQALVEEHLQTFGEVESLTGVQSDMLLDQSERVVGMIHRHKALEGRLEGLVTPKEKAEFVKNVLDVMEEVIKTHVSPSLHRAIMCDFTDGFRQKCGQIGRNDSGVP